MITQYDRKLADQWVLELGNSGKMRFQFPPRMSSESRGGEWLEVDLRDKEPEAIFMSASPRVMNIDWTYIVGESKWSPSQVSHEIQILKSYFLQVNQEGTPGLVSKFKFVLHGKSLMSGRLDNVNISYSKAYVGQGAEAFPLISEVKVVAKVWTAGAPRKVDIPGMNDQATIEWA